jgi:hypothetical protein
MYMSLLCTQSLLLQLVDMFFEGINLPGTVNLKHSCSGSSKCFQIGTRCQGKAKIPGKRPDVGTFAANHPEIYFRHFKSRYGKRIDGYFLAYECYVLTPPCNFIGPFAIYFFCREKRGYLFERSGQTAASFVDHLAGNMLGWIMLVRTCLQVVRGCCLAKEEGSCIFFFHGLELVCRFCHLSGADDQQARSQRIKGACVANPGAFQPQPAPEQTPYLANHVERRPAKRFVEQQNTALSQV